MAAVKLWDLWQRLHCGICGMNSTLAFVAAVPLWGLYHGFHLWYLWQRFHCGVCGMGFTCGVCGSGSTVAFVAAVKLWDLWQRFHCGMNATVAFVA